jgi:hypothetical protein
MEEELTALSILQGIAASFKPSAIFLAWMSVLKLIL